MSILFGLESILRYEIQSPEIVPVRLFLLQKMKGTGMFCPLYVGLNMHRAWLDLTLLSNLITTKHFMIKHGQYSCLSIHVME